MNRKKLVFDMGNVLALFDGEQILRRRGLTAQADIDLFSKTVFGSDEWQDYDRGIVEKEDAFPRLIARLPARMRELADDMLLKHVFAAENMTPLSQTETLVWQAYARGYELYLLSNAGQDFYEYRAGIPALAYFTGTFISSDYKLLKPEREIYLKFLETFSLSAGDCLFIDDLQRNIDGARRVGMDGICFNASREQIAVLYEKLEEKGIFLR